MDEYEEKHLVDLALAMRAAQILYFHTRKQDDLKTAKRLEMAMDAWLSRYCEKYRAGKNP
jgi:hypothetical protein